MVKRLYRLKIWNFPEAGEPGRYVYHLLRFTDEEFQARREFIDSGKAGELVDIERPRDATEGPWRLVV